MKKMTLSLLLAAGLATGAARGADLVSVYRDAEAYDAQFAAAKANIKAGREKLPQGRAGLLPTVGLSANTTWNHIEVHRRVTPPTDTPFRYNSSGWTVTLTQPLFRWQNWESYNQSQLQVALAESQFAAAHQDLILRVAQAYFDVLQAREAQTSAETQKSAIAEQLEAARRNFDVGTATITDTHEAQSRYDLATAAEIAAQNELLVKRQALRMVTGKDETGLANLRPGVAISAPEPANIDKWAELAETGSVSVHGAQAAYEIAKREIGKQRAGRYPTLDLVAANGLSSATGSTLIGIGTDTKAAIIGLQLAIPIFLGGSTDSREREAVALGEKAHADLENARRTAALQALQAYLGVVSGLSQVKAYEAALASSSSALDSNKLGYEVGVRINIDVLNAQS